MKKFHDKMKIIRNCPFFNKAKANSKYRNVKIDLHVMVSVELNFKQTLTLEIPK